MSARQRWFSIFIIALAFVLRVAALDLRPAHFDEGVNGSFIDGMRTEGCYRYDPGNYHGPLHFYTLFAGQQLFGRSLWVLRMPTVLIGTALIGLILAFRRFLPWRAVWVAAIGAAISPAMVFYSRYAIHEMWLPFFTLLAVYGGMGIVRREGRIGDLWAFAAGLAGMVLTKETYLIHWVAAVLALVAMRCLEWIAPLAPRAQRARPADLFEGRPADTAEPVPRTAYFSNHQIATVTLTCVAAVVLFQSGFGMYWQGVDGLVETFRLMFRKGTATGDGSEAGHHKEFFYWVKLMAWYEWPALVGLLAAPVLSLRRSTVLAPAVLLLGALLLSAGFFGAAVGIHLTGAKDFLKPDLNLADVPSLGVWLMACSAGFFVTAPAQSREMRWLCLYGLASFAAYSIIPYKTPWCIINLLWPFLFVLGQLAENLALTSDRRLVYAVGLMLAYNPLRDCWALNYVRPTYDGERYAYVHTTPDIGKLLRAVRDLARENPAERQMHGIILTDAFPLTWELNEFPHVTYFPDDADVQNYDADFILLPAHRRLEFEDRAFGIYFREPCQLRNGIKRGWLYLSAEHFASQFPGRTPEIHPRIPLKNSALPDPLRK
ncbi:MAG: flippase activity-associated protein Agl23 [Chthoniobacteraceae bacterium]